MRTTTEADPLESLRRRSSEKWGTYPPEVLPMFVAEMDFPLAPEIKAALVEAIEAGDTGYVNPHDTRAAAAFASFAHSRGWLQATIAAIEHNITVLEQQLAASLPAVRLRRPHASYLAWLDMSALGWGDDLAHVALQHAKVALSGGPAFGPPGTGHARITLNHPRAAPGSLAGSCQLRQVALRWMPHPAAGWGPGLGGSHAGAG